MRRLVIVFIIVGILITISVSTSAREVTLDEVRRVADHFLAEKFAQQSKSLQKSITLTIDSINELTSGESDEILAYVINVKPKGFMVVSSDTDIDPIIAYSFRHNCNSESKGKGSTLDIGHL